MPYWSRHFPKKYASKPFTKFNPEAAKAFFETPLHVDKDDEALLKDLKKRIKEDGRGSLNQADKELWDDIHARNEDRVSARCVPLAREIEGYFEHLDLPPFPPPLPKSSLWLGNQRPSLYEPKYIRPFYIACVQGSLDEVKRWIEEKKDTRAITLRDGLDCAAMGNQVHVAQYLIEEVGVSIHAYAVIAASENRSLPLFELFLKHGYHPNQQAPVSSRTFGTALRHCLDNDAIVCLLLDHGADPNAATFMDGRTALWSGRAVAPMDRTSGLPLDIAVEKSSLRVIKKLLDCGAKPEYSRPLHQVLGERDSRMRDDWRDVMQLVIDYGTDVNAYTLYQSTPLKIALHRGLWDVSAFLIERGANPLKQHGKDAFTVAANVAGVPWEVSEELRVYLDALCGPGPVGEAPEGAMQNPLVRLMVEAKNAKGTE